MYSLPTDIKVILVCSGEGGGGGRVREAAFQAAGEAGERVNLILPQVQGEGTVRELEESGGYETTCETPGKQDIFVKKLTQQNACF